MFTTRPNFRFAAETEPHRPRLRALALITAAIALIGGLVPTVPAQAADDPALVVTVDATYARFPSVTVTASDGSVLPSVDVAATHPDWTTQFFSCVAGQLCKDAPILGGGGNWTFTATAIGFAPVATVAAIADWVPASWVNPDQSVGVSFPDAGPGAVYNYSFVLDGGGAPITADTTDRAVTISSDRFVAGGTYVPSFSYKANPLDSGVIDGPHSIQDFFLDIAFGAPVGFSVLPGDRQIALSWDAYAGATGYRAYIRNLDDGTSSSVDTASTSYLWTGLTNGVNYDFHLTTKKDTVESVDSVHLAGIPFTTPLAGTELQVIARNASGEVTVNFPTSLARPSIASDALWEASVDGGIFTAVVMAFTGSTIAVTGLLNGHDYVLRAKAKNAAGESPAWVTSNSFRPLNVPAAPALANPIVGDLSASVTATFPSSQEAPAVGRVWEMSIFTDGTAGAWVSVTPTVSANGVFTFAGLTNGLSYGVRVKSTGVTGESAWSESATFGPYGAAPVPTITSVGRGNGTVNAAASFAPTAAQPSLAADAIWQLKTSTGAILSGTDLTMTEVGGRFVFSALTNGSAYQIRVMGSNPHGASDWSVWSDFISPASAPLALPLSPGGMANGSLTVTFPVPSAAAPITSIVWQIGTVGDDGVVEWTDASPTVTGTTASFSGLTPGVTYVAKATPSNDIGAGPESISSGQLFIGVPDRPVILIAGAQKTGLVVALQAALTDVSKPTTGYLWEVARVVGPRAGIWEPASASELAGFIIDREGTNVQVEGGFAISGLINGVRYNLHVAAINGAGRSGWAAWNPPLTPANGMAPGTIPAADNTAVPGEDTDGDGLPNAIDPDVDGDTLPNHSDPDIDGDGLANVNDDDRDNDGLINPLDETPNGIGGPNDRADDWDDPVIGAIVPAAGGSVSTTIPSRASDSSRGQTEPDVVPEVAVVEAQLLVRFPYEIGHQVPGMTVYSAGTGLMPGSEYTLVLHSTPTTLGHGSVAGDGKLEFNSTMPEDVSAGRHELVLTAVSATGKAISKTLALRIGVDGELLALSSPSSGADGTDIATLAAVKTDDTLRTVLAIGAIALWLLILAAAIWAAIVLRRRRDEAEELAVTGTNLEEEPIAVK